jgi:hypothetical protein
VRVELRRALLLFAIVLGLAAIVASLSSPRTSKPDSGSPAVAPTETASPGTAAKPVNLRFDTARAPATRRMDTGQPARVSVEVEEPGTVELQGLGLSASAEPLTPAQFDVLSSRPGHYPVRLMAVNGVRARTVGAIVIRRAR